MKSGRKRLAAAVSCSGVLMLAPLVAWATKDRVVTIGPGWAQDTKPEEPGSPAPAGGTVHAVPPQVPIGSVLGWMKSLENTPGLPSDWVECNGQELNLPGSPYHGLTLPDLNGVTGPPARFLRGATGSGGTGGSENHRHNGFLVNRAQPRTVNVSAWAHEQHLPPYHEVVWIMKVR